MPKKVFLYIGYWYLEFLAVFANIIYNNIAIYVLFVGSIHYLNIAISEKKFQSTYCCHKLLCKIHGNKALGVFVWINWLF